LGALSRAGLAEGDLIMAINRKDIKDMADFKEATKDMNLSKGVMFDILRDGKPLYITFMQQE
jgi:S1-C subfamily serine protease